MKIKKIDFNDVELDVEVEGYMIMDENEIVIIYDGYSKEKGKRFRNIEEIVQDLIHTKMKLEIAENLLIEEMEKSEDYEEIINDFFKENND